MNIQDKCKLLFPLGDLISKEEKISEFKLVAQLTHPPNLSPDEFAAFVGDIPDHFKITIKVEENDPVIFSKGLDQSKYIDDLILSFQYFEEKIEKIAFELLIDKTQTGNLRHIYDFNAFDNFWKDITPYDLLKIFKELLLENDKIFFKFLEKDLESFYTSKFTFGYVVNHSLGAINPFVINENCHFGNFQVFPFAPDYFHLIKRTGVKTAIEEKMDILTGLFSVISIFDITSIKENTFHYKLTGYRAYEGELPLDKMDSSSQIYYLIFDWIYSSKGNLADKIGLARNIISIYIDGKSLTVESSIILSIKSSYNVYLKENVSKYLEVRNKLFDDLSWISQKSSEIVEKFLVDYQRSILTFLSFFISIFIIRVISTETNSGIFNKEATILSFAFLFLSLIFFGFSRWTLYMEKERLIRKYQNLKMRYTDLLEKHDIEEILKDDSEFKYEKDFINQRVSLYSILWLITIVVLMCAILSVSSYVNWKTI
ncbi:hypothetical protein [Marivirga sp.]|uniref:hypothetical protein n=1 Tax=Marivirga sp. TaxID=2018662 RepID=UPI0025F795BB|nr:hypothetical protein [Marivirga sp.]